MIGSTLTRLALAAVLVMYLPAAVAAQEGPTTPEGIEWHLSGYAVDGEIGLVPWQIDAALQLEQGAATGSSGCNQFSGTYVLDGETLTFDPAMTMTRMACPDGESAVEDGYMANLALVATWAIEDDELMLADAGGDHILGFERSVIALTSSDVAAIAAQFGTLQSEIERIEGRIESVRIGTLRDRLGTLESQVKTLQAAQAATQRSSSRSAFSAAEKTLLKGVPPTIRGTCTPLRGSANPSGTLAAVRCKPKAGVVSEMAYYLMPYQAAERTFKSVVRREGVPQRFRCQEGRPSQMLQSPYHATGCFVDDGQANVRFIAWAANCHELDVAGTRVPEPAVYVAIEGQNARIAPLYDWATNPDEFVLAPVLRDIPHGGLPRSPACRGTL